jgi:hypothetical protein
MKSLSARSMAMLLARPNPTFSFRGMNFTVGKSGSRYATEPLATDLTDFACEAGLEPPAIESRFDGSIVNLTQVLHFAPFAENVWQGEQKSDLGADELEGPATENEVTQSQNVAQ